MIERGTYKFFPYAAPNPVYPNLYAGPQPRPYTCPVCLGRGDLDHDFYDRLGVSTSTTRVKCRSCHGRGIVIA